MQKSQGHFVLYYLTIFISCFEAFTMLCLSGHYTIDMVIGVVIALALVKNVTEFVDSQGDDSFLKMKDIQVKSA